jgi:hypothetical protein
MESLKLVKLEGCENNLFVSVNDRWYRLNNIYLLNDGEIIGETDQGWFDKDNYSKYKSIDTGLNVRLARSTVKNLNSKEAFIISIKREYNFEKDYLKADLYIPLDQVGFKLNERVSFYDYTTERLYKNEWIVNFLDPIKFVTCGDRVPLYENIDLLDKYTKLFKMFNVEDKINRNDIIKHKDFLNKLDIDFDYIEKELNWGGR